jgi:hypothetical protein
VPGLVLRYAGPPAPPLVFHSPMADIYQAPNPAPYAEARGAACALIPTERERIATDCAGPATLVRRELFDPGWRAEVNGAAVPVARADEIFQSVAVPRGPADVRFRYAPPGIGWAEGGALLGLAGLGAGLWRARARRPQNRTESASDPN